MRSSIEMGKAPPSACFWGDGFCLCGANRMTFIDLNAREKRKDIGNSPVSFRLVVG